ncbi:MAG TPA: hypothetical protein VIC62_12880 [Nakamurella sp.]
MRYSGGPRCGATEFEAWTAPHSRPRREESTGAGTMSTALLGLQRTAGNAAVAAHLGSPTVAGSPLTFMQRCGPTPCNCSADERADYAEQHPDEPATPEADATNADAGHGHG